MNTRHGGVADCAANSFGRMNIIVVRPWVRNKLFYYNLKSLRPLTLLIGRASKWLCCIVGYFSLQ
jgi:hypothetical protein